MKKFGKEVSTCITAKTVSSQTQVRATAIYCDNVVSDRMVLIKMFPNIANRLLIAF